jgi:aminopeptidase N
MHTGLESTYPIVYGVLPSDSLKMQSSFANIHQAINIFETKYGPYRFDKVGFSVVPFSGGAMEHSENISYPKNTIDGTKNYESLWSHELSHSWWGNLVKCYTSDDMWLNEGWASFSEYVFTEGVYGRQAYLNQVHAEQKNVLQYAHINDESALPLAPLPTQYTYGSTAYQKGAVIVHTLLTYMGDSLFYDACRKYLAAMAFKNHNSYQLRDSFSKYSGINLNDFFNDWVFKPGFPHFEIINTSYNQSLSEYTVNIRQNSRFNSSLYHNVPLKVSFYNDGFERFDYMINVNGYESAYQVKTHWQASLIALNADVDLSEAIGKNYTEISSTGSITLDEAMMTIKVDALPSKAFIFAEHHWIGPDHTLTETKGIRFSDYRYWTVDGIFPAGFKAEATLRYNGTESAIDGTNYLDHTLNIQNEDSLVLLYRPNKLSPWTNIKNTNATFSTFSKTDKKGSIKVINLQKGDYCLGKFDHSASTGSIPAKKDFRIYPNPARSELVIDISDNPGYYKSLKLIDSSGKIIFSGVIDNNPFIKIETSSYNKGMYIAEIITTDNVLCEKFIIE